MRFLTDELQEAEEMGQRGGKLGPLRSRNVTYRLDHSVDICSCSVGMGW
jgi:hypothetical protein